MALVIPICFGYFSEKIVACVYVLLHEVRYVCSKAHTLYNGA